MRIIPTCASPTCVEATEWLVCTHRSFRCSCRPLQHMGWRPLAARHPADVTCRRTHPRCSPVIYSDVHHLPQQPHLKVGAHLCTKLPSCPGESMYICFKVWLWLVASSSAARHDSPSGCCRSVHQV